MNGLKIVFMGTPQFAVPSLEQIVNSHHQIVGVVSQPDRPRGRGKKMLPTPVKEFSIQHRLKPVLQPVSLKEEDFLRQLSALRADVFVVVAFRILPEEVYTLPPLGTVNLHPSLLPKYRGAAPINWTIINGEETTGVTTIFIQKEIDAGNIILQEKVQVQPDETAGSLHDRLAEIGAKLLVKTLNQIERGEVKTTRQDESLVSKAPKITREITHLNFDQPAGKVKNWIHGLSPLPGAFVNYKGKKMKIFRARVISEEPVEKSPGTIVRATGDDLWIACKPGIIAVLRLQMEGKKVLETAEFLRGYSLDSSVRFE